MENKVGYSWFYAVVVQLSPYVKEGNEADDLNKCNKYGCCKQNTNKSKQWILYKVKAKICSR